MYVVGADVVSGGWVSVAWDGADTDVERFSTVANLVAEHPDAAAFVLDIPIGLPTRPPRSADAAARRLVGKRRSSVFDAPPLTVLEAPSYSEALARSRELFGKGISAQSFALKARILDARAVASNDERIVEAHPEVSFTLMLGEPAKWAKKSWNGQNVRRQTLVAHGLDLPDSLESAGATPVDDVLDAAACAWTALRVVEGEAVVLGDPSEGAIYA
jgi:predicted RNase H-like nuclease